MWRSRAVRVHRVDSKTKLRLDTTPGVETRNHHSRRYCSFIVTTRILNGLPNPWMSTHLELLPCTDFYSKLPTIDKKLIPVALRAIRPTSFKKCVFLESLTEFVKSKNCPIHAWVLVFVARSVRLVTGPILTKDGNSYDIGHGPLETETKSLYTNRIQERSQRRRFRFQIFRPISVPQLLQKS